MIPDQPVILCGGLGTRLWPLFRTGFPKRFLCLSGDEILFPQTARHLAGMGVADLDVQAPFIVTAEDHHSVVTAVSTVPPVPTFICRTFQQANLQWSTD